MDLGTPIRRRPAPMWGLVHQMGRWPKGSNMF
jgi:hypothetical protein